MIDTHELTIYILIIYIYIFFILYIFEHKMLIYQHTH